MLLYPSTATGNSEHTGNRLESSLIASANPITVSGNWPRPISTTYRGANCVQVVRAAGYYVPMNPRIFAKYLPVKSVALPPEGIPTVAKLNYSFQGHVGVVVNKGGTLYVVVDSVLLEGSVVPRERYLGQV